MADWRGGFSGVGYTRQEFKAWLSNQPKPSWVKFMVSHNTAAPYIMPSVLHSTRVKNLGNYYKNDLGWSTGPNIIVIFDRVYIGTPWAYPGTNSPGFNGKGLGVEVEGDYRTGKHDPKSGDGAIAWGTAAWVFADTLAWLRMPIDATHLKLHREDPRTSHDCPGNLVTKDWLLGLVKAATSGAVELVQPVPSEPRMAWVNTPGDFLNLRAGAGGEIRGTIPHGTKLTVLSEKLGWANVQTPAGYKGWVSAKYLSVVAPTVTPSPLPVTPPQSVPLPTSDYVLVAGLHPSEFAISWMKRFEGKALKVYDDVGSLAGLYGHNVSSGREPIWEYAGQTVYKGRKLDDAFADEVLRADAEAIAAEVRKVLKGVMLKQHQFDALVLDNFQRGQTQFTKTDVVQLLKQGNEIQASAAFHMQSARTTKDGLKRRRKIEAQIFDGEKPTKW